MLEVVRERGQWEQEAGGQQGEKRREARNWVIDLLYFYLSAFKQFLFHPQHKGASEVSVSVSPWAKG